MDTGSWKPKSLDVTINHVVTYIFCDIRNAIAYKGRNAPRHPNTAFGFLVPCKDHIFWLSPFFFKNLLLCERGTSVRYECSEYRGSSKGGIEANSMKFMAIMNTWVLETRASWCGYEPCGNLSLLRHTQCNSLQGRTRPRYTSTEFEVLASD